MVEQDGKTHSAASNLCLAGCQCGKKMCFLSVKGVKEKGEGLVVLNHTTKTVDVPASLPTPPHNNQEEMR